LDIAKDALEEGVDMRQIWDALERGEYEGTARKIAHMAGLDGGHTIYIGSRTSEKFMRLYDKGVEQHLEGADWKRLELELKGMVARAAAHQVIDTRSLTGTFNSVALGMVNLTDCHEYAKFFPAGGEELSLPAIEKHTDREAWLIKQVIPALREHIKQEGLTEAVKALRALLDVLAD
jgi:DNA relaxase NicK